MRRKFLSIGCLVLTCLYQMVISKKIDPDFVEENGKALKNLRVLPGVRRSVANVQEAEQAAGKAVLHLLDAKIGNKVKEAAKEVTDFLNGAVGSHAEVRANKLHSEKDKELSLLSVTAGKKLADKQKPLKKKKESFLLNFKIPYLVTPVVAKKKQKKKKNHAHKHHHHKHHRKAHHHKHQHKVHHHKASHSHHKVLNTLPALAHPAIQHPAVRPNPPQAAPTQHVTQPNYNAVDLSWDGYNWSARPVNSTLPSSDMIPCQGACADPCNPACNLQTDCCCCPTQGTAPAAAPALPQPNIQEPPPNFLQIPSANLPPSAPSPVAPQTTCVPVCKRSCLSFCPQSCCGFQEKRNNVAVSTENSSGSGSGMELDP